MVSCVSGKEKMLGMRGSRGFLEKAKTDRDVLILYFLCNESWSSFAPVQDLYEVG